MQQEAHARIQYVPTTDTSLVLNFAEVIQLTEEYYAPASLGNFQTTLCRSLPKKHNVYWHGNKYELVILVTNPGAFVNERGTSSTFLGLLTKQEVLDALQQQPDNNNKVHGMVVGFLDNIHSGIGWIKSKLPMVKDGFAHAPHQYPQTGANVMRAWQGAPTHRQPTCLLNHTIARKKD